MWFSVAWMKFHWSGINWHGFNQSECRNCCLYIIIQKIAPQAKSEKYFQIWFFPRFGGKKWRRSEHAHASYPGLFFRPPGFSPYMGREERRVQGLDYGWWQLAEWDIICRGLDIVTDKTKKNKTFNKRKNRALLTLRRSQKHYEIFSNNVLRENITRKQFKRWLGIVSISQTALRYLVMRTQSKYWL